MTSLPLLVSSVPGDRGYDLIPSLSLLEYMLIFITKDEVNEAHYVHVHVQVHVHDDDDILGYVATTLAGHQVAPICRKGALLVW